MDKGSFSSTGTQELLCPKGKVKLPFYRYLKCGLFNKLSSTSVGVIGAIKRLPSSALLDIEKSSPLRELLRRMREIFARVFSTIALNLQH